MTGAALGRTALIGALLRVQQYACVGTRYYNDGTSGIADGALRFVVRGLESRGLKQ
jgi:hypothetical protein